MSSRVFWRVNPKTSDTFVSYCIYCGRVLRGLGLNYKEGTVKKTSGVKVTSVRKRNPEFENPDGCGEDETRVRSFGNTSTGTFLEILLLYYKLPDPGMMS